MHVFTVLKTVNRFETYFIAYYVYFTAELHQLKKTFGQFENLVFVIMSTWENIRFITRTPFKLSSILSGSKILLRIRII